MSFCQACQTSFCFCRVGGRPRAALPEADDRYQPDPDDFQPEMDGYRGHAQGRSRPRFLLDSAVASPTPPPRSLAILASRVQLVLLFMTHELNHHESKTSLHFSHGVASLPRGSLPHTATPAFFLLGCICGTSLAAWASEPQAFMVSICTCHCPVGASACNPEQRCIMPPSLRCC